MRTFFRDGPAYSWYQVNGVAFCGYCIAESTYRSGLDAANWLKECLVCAEAPEDLFRSMNGSFCAVVEKADSILFLVDRVRSLPLFYAKVGGELWVGDDAPALAEALPHRELDPLSAEILDDTKLFVTGQRTLLRELYQVEAGSFCAYDKNTQEIAVHPYFSMVPGELEQDPAVLMEEFHAAYQTAGRHLVQALRGRKAVIPLSGGADSRMVATMLKNQGYDNVLCFTYGRPGNEDSTLSRQAAEAFGFPWKMIPYTPGTWSALRKDPIFPAYCKFAFQYTSTPHLQDFPAVRALHESGDLDRDSVFIPGHSGDLIAGSHITPEFLRNTMTQEELLESVFSKFFILPPNAAIRLEIAGRFPESGPECMEEKAAQSTWFNIQERQAKYIVNSVRAYEFFGYEWLIPLWDNVLFDFWAKVPLALRYNRRLYFAAVNDTRVAFTATPTLQKSLAEEIRRLPVVRTAARRGTRILRYYRSRNYAEHLYPFAEYMRGCLFGNELFDIRHLICQQQLENTKRLLYSGHE